LLHGEAISMGMCFVGKLSVKRAGLSETESKRLCGLLEASGLPTRPTEKFDMNRLLEAMRLDKKAREGKLRFVLLKRLGEAVVSDAVTDANIEEVFNVCCR